METLMAAEMPQQKAWGLAQRLTRLLRRKRSSSGSSVAYSVASDAYDQSLDSSISSLSKLKLSGNMAAAYSLDAFFKSAAEKKNGAPRQSPVPAADAHAFVASLYAGVSAVKASYAQLQLAQQPYDADAIQLGDAALVAELGKLSDQKRRYARDPVGTVKNAAAGPASIADEQRHLIRTYEITARKLETELRARDADAERARSELADELRAGRALEERVHPGRTLAALDDLHLSGLNATHFNTALRHAVKSVRSFARSMLDEMRVAGWDPTAAASAVHPGVPLGRSGDAKFALESYVALKMFTNFHRRDFGLSCLRDRGAYDRRRFFEEFAELKSAPATALPDARWGALGQFLRDRYSSVVHERMEAAFFGMRSMQRGAVRTRTALPATAWFAEFAEMARRVWLLHCLFFAFDGGEDGASIFQARSGERFSEVYMESVSDMDGEEGGGMTLAPASNRVVGFTVVPGFKVGRSVMQCRVYLSRPARRT